MLIGVVVAVVPNDTYRWRDFLAKEVSREEPDARSTRKEGVSAQFKQV